MSREMRKKSIAVVALIVILCGIYIFRVLLIPAPSAPTVPSASFFNLLPENGSPSFAQTLVSTSSENIKIIQTGDEFMQTLIDAIDNASSSILMTDYAWSNGTFSDTVFTALTSAARHGVTVRILLDAVGGHTVPSALIDSLETAGGVVLKYHPFSIFHPFQFDDRDHARIIVIDGDIGFLGGMGIGDDWIKNPPGTSKIAEWKDLMFEVGGSVRNGKSEKSSGMAKSMENDFDKMWNETTKGTTTDTTPVIQTSSTTPPFIDIINIPSGESGNRGNGGQESSDRETPSPIHDTFLSSIAAAHKSIYIVSPFILPDRDILDELEAKARSGVDVRIVSPGDSTYAPILRSAWQADYGELLKAGVKLYEYEPSMIHEKYLVIDGAWSVIGSANMDSRSEILNAENIMGISSPVLANQLTTIFMNDISQSKQITLLEWGGRSVFAKMWSGFLLVFSKQF